MSERHRRPYDDVIHMIGWTRERGALVGIVTRYDAVRALTGGGT